ncbi:MAG: SulP family inorganic anion transporter [Geodermatophilaceae bacterium]
MIVIGRRLSPLVPAALIAAAIALLLNRSGAVDVPAVGSIPSGFPPLNIDLPWHGVGAVIVPGVVIALVGFAEAASISRRYASEDRRHWDPNREFMGQGFANIGAGLFSGYPAGGSFSRSSLNRLSGARTRWSGVLTGVAILAFMPAAAILSGLPRAALAGLVIAAVLPLIEIRPFVEAWRHSRPQFLVALPTFLATIAFAPRVERGVILGVGLSLAVHLWRELRLEVDTWIAGEHPARAAAGRSVLRVRVPAWRRK